MNMANHASASERKIIRNRGSCQRVKDLLKKLCFSKYINFSTISVLCMQSIIVYVASQLQTWSTYDAGDDA